MKVKTGGHEALICEHPYLAWLCWLVSKKTGIPWYCIPTISNTSVSALWVKWWWPILQFYERWAFRKANKLFFITPEDRAFAVKNWNIPDTKCMGSAFRRYGPPGTLQIKR